MDFDDTEEDAAFRREVSVWLKEHAQVRTGLDNWSRNPMHPDYVRRCREWQHTLFEGGWGAITWPTRYGGRGDSAWHQAIFNQEVARYDVSVGVFSVGIGMAGPTLIAHGSEEQKHRYLSANAEGRGGLVPAVLRARRRVGPRRAEDPRRARRGRVRRERSEGLDIGCPTQ